MRKIVNTILITGLLTACGSSTDVITTLHNPANLAEGTMVYLGGDLAGEVVDIVYDGQSATIRIELAGDHFSRVDRSAIVVQNTMKDGYPLEIHNSNTPLGMVENGVELRGLDSMLQFGAWSIGDAISVGSETAANYLVQMQDYLESQDWEHQKQEIREQIRSAGDSATKAVNDVSKELNETVEKLRELEAEAVATSERLGEQLGQDLTDILGEFRDSGEALASELEKLAAQLDENDYGAAAGQGFLDMLQAMLEGLNRGSGAQGGSGMGAPGESESGDSDHEGADGDAGEREESAIL